MLYQKVLDFICQKVLENNFHFLSESTCRLHVLASNKFPHAETLISDAIGTDNEYSKTAYHYLYSLYSRWHKNDRAFEYKDKILKPL